MTDIFLDTNLSKDINELEQIIDKISFLNEYDILSYAYTLLPGWILHKTSSYTSEYSHLQHNWNELCRRWNTTPKYILAVSFMPMNNNFKGYTILQTFCNLLTKGGYVIRSHLHVAACQKCERMMISRDVWTHFKKQFDEHRAKNPDSVLHKNIPMEWNPVCGECMGYLPDAPEA
jgi:hypothetical protein